MENGKPVASHTRRNPGVPLRMEWFDGIRINTPASERRAASLPARRSLKKDWQAAWLLNAVRCIDLTTLSGDDTPDRVARLCAKARAPIEAGQLAALGVEGLTTGAVCVYPTMVAAAKRALEGSGVPVASVATGFPAGLMPLDLRLAEIRYALDQGADEIDIVISRAHVLQGNWSALYDELCAMREACGAALMKSILATGELKTLENVAKASHVAMQAGSDFIKTSTGKEPVNATLPVSLTMLRTIRDYRDQTGFAVGFKPAGGLRTAKDALNWQVLMLEELGRDWLRPDLFRIGASSLLGDIERQISHHVTGRYAAAHRLAAG
ncbi:deoxyribose-phosphate aldolase [Paracoccus sp. PAR01]|uniref:deoxyribose-phosphate aldolase n=1 Tax=Paracoccus sp. PAR01 TaxID=2769282 RepID=UPI00177ECC24|nr:deoxyribose-phosphate aldolase [Paracoccus sp. PAR01]MBD9526901.1 deoxyribose-phosphate aldolase [Paracoccus sp. PAR01]